MTTSVVCTWDGSQGGKKLRCDVHLSPALCFIRTLLTGRRPLVSNAVVFNSVTSHAETGRKLKH